jgi:hypothetical protein
MATLCANVNCVAHTEDRGGRKVFNKADGKWYCDGCFHVEMIGSEGKNLWDFTTSHGDGKPTHIKSLAELRAYERRTGTSNQLANNYERNCR